MVTRQLTSLTLVFTLLLSPCFQFTAQAGGVGDYYIHQHMEKQAAKRQAEQARQREAEENARRGREALAFFQDPSAIKTSADPRELVLRLSCKTNNIEPQFLTDFSLFAHAYYRGMIEMDSVTRLSRIEHSQKTIDSIIKKIKGGFEVSPNYVPKMVYLNCVGQVMPEAVYHIGMSVQNRWEREYFMEYLAFSRSEFSKRHHSSKVAVYSVGAILGTLVSIAIFRKVRANPGSYFSKFKTIWHTARAKVTGMGVMGSLDFLVTGGGVMGAGISFPEAISGYLRQDLRSTTIPFAPAELLDVTSFNRKKTRLNRGQNVTPARTTLEDQVWEDHVVKSALEMGITFTPELLYGALLAGRALGAVASAPTPEKAALPVWAVQIILSSALLIGTPYAIDAYTESQIKDAIVAARDKMRRAYFDQNDHDLYQGAIELYEAALKASLHVYLPVIEATRNFMEEAHQAKDSPKELAAIQANYKNEVQAIVLENHWHNHHSLQSFTARSISRKFGFENTKTFVQDNIADDSPERLIMELDVKRFEQGIERSLPNYQEQHQMTLDRDMAYRQYLDQLDHDLGKKLDRGFIRLELREHPDHILMQAARYIESYNKPILHPIADALEASIVKNHLSELGFFEAEGK